jgi:hypothetical protein
MVGKRGREYFDRCERAQVEDGWPAGDRLPALIETPHEASLRVALYAARIDAIIVGCRAIAVKAEMDAVRSDCGVPIDKRCRRP